MFTVIKVNLVTRYGKVLLYVCVCVCVTVWMWVWVYVCACARMRNRPFLWDVISTVACEFHEVVPFWLGNKKKSWMGSDLCKFLGFPAFNLFYWGVSREPSNLAADLLITRKDGAFASEALLELNLYRSWLSCFWVLDFPPLMHLPFMRYIKARLTTLEACTPI